MYRRFREEKCIYRRLGESLHARRVSEPSIRNSQPAMYTFFLPELSANSCYDDDSQQVSDNFRAERLKLATSCSAFQISRVALRVATVLETR